MNLKHFSNLILRGITALLLSGLLAAAGPVRAAFAPAPALPDPHYLQAGAPMADLDMGKYSGFTLGDVDGDGDTDALVGDMSGRLVYFRNAGGPNIGSSFYRELDSRYPLGLRTQDVNYSDGVALSYIHPELVDNDGDGDKDLFIATVDRNPDRVVTPTMVVDYYQNQGSYFQKVAGDGGNVPSITWIPNWGCRQAYDYDYNGQGYPSLPWDKDMITLAVGDLNGDGAMDGVVGVIFTDLSQHKQYELRIYMGVKPVAGIKQCPLLIANYASLPQDLRLPGERPFPELHDADGDGDLDLFVGLSSGVVRYFQNTGTVTSPSFTLRKGALNPLNPLGTTNPSTEPDFGAYVVPEFGHLTLDKNFDFAALSGDGHVVSMYYDYEPEVKHLVPWLTPADFLIPLDAGGRIVGFDEGAGTATFADLDGDGDADALTGGKDGAIRNYKNLIAETGQRRFVELTGAARWFPANMAAFPFGAPLLANFDGQEGDPGDADLVIAAKVTTCPDISTGTGSLLSAEEPMQPPDVAPASPPMSLAVDSDPWRLCYYENEGSSTLPDFQLNASPEAGDRYDPFLDSGLPVLASGQYLIPSVVAADNYETFPDLIIGSKAGDFAYLRNFGDSFGPGFTLGIPAELGLDTLSIPFGAPVFLDVDNDTSPDLVVGTADGQVRYFHNDQSPDDPGNGINNPIGPFTEITGADNPFSFLHTGQYAAPTFNDLDGDGDLDLALGSVLNAFRFYENVTPPGGSSPLAYIDYRLNPLGSVVPPNYAATFYRSANFADVDGDGDQDAIVGSSSVSQFVTDYYLNIGTPQKPVFRVQPVERSPFENLPSPETIVNMTLADTHPSIPGLEAYVGARTGGKGYLKAYEYDTTEQKYVEMASQPFFVGTTNGFYTNYEVGTRVAFVLNQDSGCLNAYVTMGSFAQSGYNSFYAVNQFTCEGLDEDGAPIYTLPLNPLAFEGNVGSAANPFYILNWPARHYFNSGEWNGSMVSPDTWWFGNGNGEVHTLVNGFYDSGNDAYYIGRITDYRDPFKNVKLPNPTIPTAADTNADGYVDAYIGSSNGTIQYFVGSATPPPSPDSGPGKVYLPLITK